MPRGRKKTETLPPPANDQERSERQILIKAKTDFIIAEQYKISTIQEGIKAARGVLRSLGHKAIDFAVAKRLYELEVEEREKSIASIKEMCAALGVGGQVNFLDALQADENVEATEAEEIGGEPWQEGDPETVEIGDDDGKGQPAAIGDGEPEIKPEADHGEVGAAPATDAELDEAGKTHKAGYDAGYAGDPFEANPHKKGRAPYKIWAKGWEAGSTKRLGEQDAARHEPVASAIVDGAVGVLDGLVAGAQAGALSAETAAAGSA